MYLWLLLAFPLIGFVHGSNRFSEPDFKAVNFAEAIKDQKLNESIFRELEVVSETSCQLNCVREDRCLSYNVLPIQGKGTNRCQLSDSDRFVGHANFTKEVGALYRGIQVIILYDLDSIKLLVGELIKMFREFGISPSSSNLSDSTLNQNVEFFVEASFHTLHFLIEQGRC